MSFEPILPKPTHTCTAPTFGCPDCITSDKEAWGKAKYAAWEKTYKFPKCPACGGPTKAWEWTVKNTALSILIGCIDMNAEEGVCPCADEDFEIEVP